MIIITDKLLCCGCSACANSCPKNCIEMQQDSEGFLYPHVNINICIDCGLCEKACPIIQHKEPTKNTAQQAVLIQHRHDIVLKQSTAGGAFTAIAEYVLNHGGIVFGAEMGDDFVVRHSFVDNKEQLKKYRNSKYVQSEIGTCYQDAKAFLDSGTMVCFSGTPCQIEGFRHYLKRKYDNLILVDVVCRAVPSPGVWKKYIEMEQAKYGVIESVRFRDKTLGYQYSTMEIICADGKIRREGIESHPWLRMFFSGMIIRPSCTECKFRSRYRHSDFTIWDCFNIYKLDKSFNEDCGVTRMVIHSEKGKNIFDSIKKDLRYRMIPPEIAVDGVKEMLQSPVFHDKRSEFFKDYMVNPINSVIKKYFPYTFKTKLKKYARLFLNKFKLDKKIKHLKK